MYLLSCPTATTIIRIAAVVVVLQELPVVAACNKQSTMQWLQEVDFVTTCYSNMFVTRDT